MRLIWPRSGVRANVLEERNPERQALPPQAASRNHSHHHAPWCPGTTLMMKGKENWFSQPCSPDTSTPPRCVLAHLGGMFSRGTRGKNTQWCPPSNLGVSVPGTQCLCLHNGIYLFLTEDANGRRYMHFYREKIRLFIFLKSLKGPSNTIRQTQCLFVCFLQTIKDTEASVVLWKKQNFVCLNIFSQDRKRYRLL